MSAKTIHYKHPKLGYHACGMGDPLTIQISEDINKVTCKRCQDTITGRKNASSPEGYPNLTRAGKGRPTTDTVELRTRIRPETRQYLEQLGGGSKSIGKAIELLVQQHQEKL